MARHAFGAHSVRPELHDYQRVAVGHLHRNPRAGLFLDMGLGKTAVSLTALRPGDLPAIVTAPKRVTENVWLGEAETWRPDLRVGIAKGNPAQRAAVLRDPRNDVVVLSRDNLGDPAALDRPWRTFILDELSGFKARGSKRWKYARRIAAGYLIENIWGLTGTPSPNGLIDLWSQLFLLDDGARLGRTKTGFLDTYFRPGLRLPNGVVASWDLLPGADVAIRGLVDDICLSMGTEGRIPLPPTTYNLVDVPMSPAGRRIYKELKANLVVTVEETHTAGTTAILGNKLSQISAGFLFVDEAQTRDGEYVRIHDEKTRTLTEVVEGTGSPVLVFYHYRPELEAIRRELGDRAHTIDEPDIVGRWNRGEIPVLVTHPASAGHGLNLQYGGHTIVWTTLPHSLEEWEQGNKRLARQNQANPVIIHVLSSPNTVDGHIYAALRAKASVQQVLLDHLESPL